MSISDLEATLIDVIAEILPDVDLASIHPESTLVELGANSVDRMEIISELLEVCGAQVPMVEFVGASTVREIARRAGAKSPAMV